MRFTKHAAELAGIAPGSEVVSRDLETVGTVRRLIFDAEGVELIGIIVRAGSRRGDDRKLPCALLARLDDGAVYLSVSREELLGRP